MAKTFLEDRVAGNNNRSTIQEDDFILSFDEVSERDPIRFADVPIPEWGTNARGEPKKVRVMAMSDFDRRRFIALGQTVDLENPGMTKRNAEFYDSGRHDVELLYRSCRKADGSELFTRDQWTSLGNQRDPVPFIRLIDAAMKVNVLDDDTFNELRKNSVQPSATQTIDSPSPSTSEALSS